MHFFIFPYFRSLQLVWGGKFRSNVILVDFFSMVKFYIMFLMFLTSHNDAYSNVIDLALKSCLCVLILLIVL